MDMRTDKITYTLEESETRVTRAYKVMWSVVIAIAALCFWEYEAIDHFCGIQAQNTIDRIGIEQNNYPDMVGMCFRDEFLGL